MNYSKTEDEERLHQQQAANHSFTSNESSIWTLSKLFGRQRPLLPLTNADLTQTKKTNGLLHKMVFLLACSGIIGTVAYCATANEANEAQSNYGEANYHNGRTLKSEEDERAMQFAWREVAEAEAEEGQSKLKEKLMKADQKDGEKAAKVNEGKRNKLNGDKGDERVLRLNWKLVDEAKRARDQNKLNERFRESKQVEMEVVDRALDKVRLLEKELEEPWDAEQMRQTNEKLQQAQWHYTDMKKIILLREILRLEKRQRRPLSADDPQAIQHILNWRRDQFTQMCADDGREPQWAEVKEPVKLHLNHLDVTAMLQAWKEVEDAEKEGDQIKLKQRLRDAEKLLLHLKENYNSGAIPAELTCHAEEIVRKLEKLPKEQQAEADGGKKLSNLPSLHR